MTSWEEILIDGDKPKGDLLRVEAKIDHVIAMLNTIHRIITGADAKKEAQPAQEQPPF